MKNFFLSILLVLVLLNIFVLTAQQEPHFAQYTYNTMTVNPAYAGSKEYLSAIGMHRSQWVGVNGAPTTQFVSLHGPTESTVGWGIGISNEALGPVNNLVFDANFSHTVPLHHKNKKLSFGLRAGARVFDVDFSKGLAENEDIAFQTNIQNKFLGSIGAGVYYRSEKTYVGLSVPNFFTQEYYDPLEQEIDVARLHFFLIAGTVFEWNKEVLLKPSIFSKWETNNDWVADIALSALFKETLNVGLAYRLGDSIAALLGVQIVPSIHIGYSYNLNNKELKGYNFGTHEILIRYDFKNGKTRFNAPRFF